MLKGSPRFKAIGRPRGTKAIGSNAPFLSVSGETTIVEGNGTTLMLSVVHNPAVNPYDGFAEVADADGIASLTDDEITISDVLDPGTYSITYKATSSGGRPDIIKAIIITVQDDGIIVPPSDGWTWEDGEAMLWEDGAAIDLEA